MPENEVIELSEQSLAPVTATEKRVIEVPGAPPVRLQTLDLARHIATAPDGKRYVVATFDDSRMGRDIVTAVFPQLNGYLTLVRLPVVEYSTKESEEAEKRHIDLILAIQQGKLKTYIQNNQ
jgi:hypothetical protein